MSGPRRRQGAPKQQHHNVAGSSAANNHNKGDKSQGAQAPAPRVINAGPSLEKAARYGIDDTRSVSSRAMALVGRMFIEMIPAALSIGVMLALIFGGCCSNVFALESIVKVEPDSGMLLRPPGPADRAVPKRD